MDGLTERRATLRAALGFLALDPCEPELRLLHRWVDSWRGVGDVVTDHDGRSLASTKTHGEETP
jgi:hypothetical protein